MRGMISVQIETFQTELNTERHLRQYSKIVLHCLHHEIELIECNAIFIKIISMMPSRGLAE